MKGSIQRSGRSSWRIRIEVDPDPQTGKRRWDSFVVRGGRRVAQNELTKLQAARNGGMLPERSALSVGAFVHQRIDYWEQMGEIRSRTGGRYRQLVDRQIVPHIGN